MVTSDFAAFFGAKESEIMLRLDAILTPGRSNTGRVWCLRELTGVCNNSKALVRIPASVISIEEQEPKQRCQLKIGSKSKKSESRNLVANWKNPAAWQEAETKILFGSGALI